MKIIRTNDQCFRTACANLSQSRELKSKAEKLEKSAKGFIAGELRKQGVILEKLDVGETLVIKVKGEEGYEDVIRVTIKSMNRVDLAKLTQDFPMTEEACRRDFPSIFYDALLEGKEDGNGESSSLEESLARLDIKKKELERSIAMIEKLTKTVPV